VSSTIIEDENHHNYKNECNKKTYESLDNMQPQIEPQIEPMCKGSMSRNLVIILFENFVIIIELYFQYS